MKPKSGFLNLPKLQAKKFGRFRREKTRQRIVTAIKRFLGRNAT
ncbi:MAG: hypothetical protein ACREI3_07760 [Nitrospirales bacterium]